MDQDSQTAKPRRKRLGPTTKEGWEAILVGRRVGKLVVDGIERRLDNRLTHGKNIHSAHYALCVCDCGNRYSCQCSFLLAEKVKSCGCNYSRFGKDSPNFRGVGDVSKTLMTRLKHSAMRTGRVLEVDAEYLWHLYLAQDRRCYFSGVPIYFRLRRTTVDKFHLASLDRLDSTIGYVAGNVAWTSWVVNMMKKNYTTDCFVDLCCKVAAVSRRRTKTVDQNERLF